MTMLDEAACKVPGVGVGDGLVDGVMFAFGVGVAGAGAGAGLG